MTRILFTGYAPVHFVCFRPLFAALRREPGVEVLVSGGLKWRDASGTRRHDTEAMYAEFDLPEDAVVPAAELPDLDVDVLFCANTKAIAPRRHEESVQIFHGLSFRNRAVREENAGYDHYFVLGPYMRRAFERRGLFSAGDARLVSVGFPKTDRLLGGTLEREGIVRELGFSGERPVVLYAPTGARGNSLETCGEELLGRLDGAERYDVIVKPHDHPKNAIDWYERLARLEGDHLRLLRTSDTVPALVASDLLISDASSIANEYLLLDRPIVFVDVPELLEAASAEDDRLDLETWGRRGGVAVAGAAAAVDAVARGLAHPDEQSVTRRAIADDLFYNPGGATEAALNWLGARLRLAA
jgi:CDP-Glycerol:Poly(glycerophosphate) glycerophosphotransferase